MTKLATAILVSLLFGVSASRAQTVIDGDTIEYKGVVLRLWGIDAPEKAQTCSDGWAAGKAAIDYYQRAFGATVDHREVVERVRELKRVRAEVEDLKAILADAAADAEVRPPGAHVSQRCLWRAGLLSRPPKPIRTKPSRAQKRRPAVAGRLFVWSASRAERDQNFQLTLP